MNTVTATTYPSFTSTVYVPGQTEKAHELNPVTNAQALMDNTEYCRRLQATLGIYSQGANATWKFNAASDGMVGETCLLITATNNCDLSLSNSNAFVGLTLEVRTGAGAYTLTVKNSAGGGSTIQAMTQNTSYVFKFDGSLWILWR